MNMRKRGEGPNSSRRWLQMRMRMLTIFYCIIILLSTNLTALAALPQIVDSSDGTPISYEIHGDGEPTLIFIHGWSCDSRYWREQVLHFSKKHRTVFIDLAGHGHSGTGRSEYSMKAFGEDVQAVVEATGEGENILIGHSMGGAVIAEAARLVPGRVIGLIGIDTLTDIEYKMTQEELDQMTEPLIKDFRSGSHSFVSSMLSPQGDEPLREWILADMSSASPKIALSAMNNLMQQYISGEAAKVFDQISVPVITVNGDLWPVNFESNRRHMSFFDAIVLKDSDHFLMLTRPEEFNRALEKAIAKVIELQKK